MRYSGPIAGRLQGSRWAVHRHKVMTTVASSNHRESGGVQESRWAGRLPPCRLLDKDLQAATRALSSAASVNNCASEEPSRRAFGLTGERTPSPIGGAAVRARRETRTPGQSASWLLMSMPLFAKVPGAARSSH